ncbi:7826_t:CDS:2 [Gigaspora margarita]|uniref:7826_t:CDS:1 n=1 Tax=Gigaspora margarita TaxID=4874 RepID=A0ABN7UQG9_GIGMA|nr:7826_t:CDS:2 [Gigaspora margarita]
MFWKLLHQLYPTECSVSGGAPIPETFGTDHDQEFVFNTAISENTLATSLDSDIEPPYMIIFPSWAKYNN